MQAVSVGVDVGKTRDERRALREQVRGLLAEGKSKNAIMRELGVARQSIDAWAPDMVTTKSGSTREAIAAIDAETPGLSHAEVERRLNERYGIKLSRQRVAIIRGRIDVPDLTTRVTFKVSAEPDAIEAVNERLVELDCVAEHGSKAGQPSLGLFVERWADGRYVVTETDESS